MRRVRSRLTILLCILVAVTCAVSVTLSALARRGLLLERDVSRYLMFGFAFKDLLLLLCIAAAAAAAILLVSHSTTNPIVDLTKAAEEVARGNFDVQVRLRGRTAEVAELQESFNAMVRELKANEYLRKDFLYNVSHELKTPLTVIGGYARLLEEGGLSPAEQTEFARLIARESGRLVGMTSNMLRLAKIENNRLPPETSEFSLDEQLRQAALLFAPRCEAAGLTLEAELEDARFSGDEELLGEVWRNLLDNAVKFTPAPGTIRVTLRREEGFWAACVADTGCGMDAAAKSRMFDRFYQGDVSHKPEGSGLGLALVRRIVELHGGLIRVESAPGEGCAVTVCLPAAESAEPAPTKAALRKARRKKRRSARKAERRERRGSAQS